MIQTQEYTLKDRICPFCGDYIAGLNDNTRCCSDYTYNIEMSRKVSRLTDAIRRVEARRPKHKYCIVEELVKI